MRYGAKRGLRGTSLPEFQAWVTKQGFVDYTSSAPHQIRKQEALEDFLLKCFEIIQVSTKQPKKKLTYVLKNKYYSKLIEYKALQKNNEAVKKCE